MRVLSIDWDYFMDCTAEERYELFPRQVDENMAEEKKWGLWSKVYRDTQRAARVGVLYKDYDKVANYLKVTDSSNLGLLKVADSHLDILNFLDSASQNFDPKEGLHIVNIDFHHDRFSIHSEKPDCANWANHIRDFLPDGRSTFIKYQWVAREDSERRVFFDEEFNKDDILTMDEAMAYSYDAIFICKSPTWSPPHLDRQYDSLVRTVFNKMH